MIDKTKKCLEKMEKRGHIYALWRNSCMAHGYIFEESMFNKDLFYIHERLTKLQEIVNFCPLFAKSTVMCHLIKRKTKVFVYIYEEDDIQIVRTIVADFEKACKKDGIRYLQIELTMDGCPE